VAERRGMKLGVDAASRRLDAGAVRRAVGEGGTFHGVNTTKQAPYTEVVKELNRLGWRVATHAVGDAAIDEVLAAYERPTRRGRSPDAAGR